MDSTSDEFGPTLQPGVGGLSSAPRKVSLQVSTSFSPEKSAKIQSYAAENKRGLESKKLLFHILERLKARPKPPSVFEPFKSAGVQQGASKMVAVVQTVRVAVRMARVPPIDDNSGDSDEEEGKKQFSTHIATDLLTQLRDALSVVYQLGWNVLSSSPPAGPLPALYTPSSPQSPFRIRRSSSTSPKGWSRSPEPPRQQPPDLLEQIISTIASIVSEDCRFHVSNPRLTMPPNALQAVVLDVAILVAKMQASEPKVLSAIAFAFIPAFYTFSPNMHTRLLAFFEDGILRGMLEDLKWIQGGRSILPPKTGESLTEPHPIVEIQVVQPGEEPHLEAEEGHWQPWTSPSSLPNVLPSTAPSQSIAIYQLSSIIPPLLASIFESVDLSTAPLPTLHRLHRLLDHVTAVKHDAYLDLLEVVAYHAPKARHAALRIIASFWPKALGHVVVGRPFPRFDYVADTASHNGGRVHPKGHSYTHEFIPWRFPIPEASNVEGSTTPLSKVSFNACHVCSDPIHGFGLLCAFCTCAVHFNCYDPPDGSSLIQYTSPSDRNTQKLAMFRYSVVLSSRPPSLKEIRDGTHYFRAVNIFTLTLCLVCHMPLWGHTMQALQCSHCQHFVHPSCLLAPSTTLADCRSSRFIADHMNINWEKLRRSFVDHYRDYFHHEDSLLRRTYEEISVFYDILWVQHRILLNGVASGSIVIEQKHPRTPVSSRENGNDEFELHFFIRLYQAYLTHGRLTKSPELDEYLREARSPTAGHSILFDWPLLGYVATLIKTPLHPDSLSNSANLLQVTVMDDAHEQYDLNHPFEVVPLSHIRDVLGYRFQLYHDAAARTFLTTLHNMGFFQRLDSDPTLFSPSTVVTATPCVFPLPLAVDVSNSVETLFTAIEACLNDINISVNEYGFLLLVRRCWPNGMATEYALSRLTRIVLYWILAEDDQLVVIARDYVTKGKPLPGVRSTLEEKSWPSARNARPVASSSVNSGGDYVACRRLLLTRYAARWLFALHDQDEVLYARILFEQCADLAHDSGYPAIPEEILPPEGGEEAQLLSQVTSADTTLRYIVKLDQCSVTFSSFNNLIVSLLDTLSDQHSLNKPLMYKSLPRLFNREADMSRRSMTEASLSTYDPVGSHITDAWNVLLAASSEDLAGLKRSLQWLLVLAHSAVDVPATVFSQLSDLGRKLKMSFLQAVVLAEAMMNSAWLKPGGKENLLDLIPELHAYFADWIQDNLRNDEHSENILHFIRHTLATCLLLYGSEREAILFCSLIRPEEIRNLLPFKKGSTRLPISNPQILAETDLIKYLSRYITDGSDTICCFIAQFLHLLVNQTSLFEMQAIDDFILVNGYELSRCIWRFYDIQRHELSTLRTILLLRILAIDSLPLDSILRTTLRDAGTWEPRFQAVAKLFRIVLDVNSPSFQGAGRQWRANAVLLFTHFFSAQWLDPREEVRVTVESLSKTLLQAHFEAIGHCFDEYLSKSSIPERMRLVSFLIQLHPHFPKWKVLSWETIIAAMGEGHQPPETFDEATKRRALISRADVDLTALRVLLVDLSLQMLADGITADLLSLLKIKYTLVKLLGFNDAILVPNGRTFYVQFDNLQELVEGSFSCVHSLQRTLDATVPCYLPPCSMGSRDDGMISALVGTVMVDVVLVLVTTVNLTQLPYLICRSFIECLIIIIYKHDFQSAVLVHWHERLSNAVQRVTDLISMDVSNDIRQLALSVARGYFKKSQQTVSRMLSSQIFTVSQFLTSSELGGDELLAAQSKAFLDNVFTQYSSRGLFWVLFKKDIEPQFFDVLRDVLKDHLKANPEESVGHEGENLRDAIVRETFQQIMQHPNEQRVLSTVTENLARYVDVVHHQSYPASLLEFIGLSLTSIARRTSDWGIDDFNPNFLLTMCATLAQHHKHHSRDLILHTETLLRLSLVRFSVTKDCLERLLHVTATIYRRSTSIGLQFSSNHVVAGLLDILYDALRGKSRVPSASLSSLLETVSTSITSERPFFAIGDIVRVAAEGISYLQTHSYSVDAFSANLAVARLVLEASRQDSSLLSSSLSSEISKPGRSSLSIRAWNYLALAALESKSSACASNLLVFLSAFSLSYTSALRSHLVTSPFGRGPSDMATTDINQAYAGLKLWLLLARNKFRDDTLIVQTSNEDSSQMELLVWNELWPPFSRLVTASVNLASSDAYMPICAFVWSTMAGLVVFMQQAQLAVPLAIAQKTMLLHFRALDGSSSLISKITHARQSASDLPSPASMEVLVGQARSDFVIAEKLLSTGREERR